MYTYIHISFEPILTPSETHWTIPLNAFLVVTFYENTKLPFLL